MQYERHEHEPRHINTKDAQTALRHESMNTRRRVQTRLTSTTETGPKAALFQAEIAEIEKQLQGLEYTRNHVQDQRAATLDQRASLLDEHAIQLTALAFRLQDDRDLLGTQKEEVVSAAPRAERLFTPEECQSRIRAGTDKPEEQAVRLKMWENVIFLVCLAIFLICVLVGSTFVMVVIGLY